MNKWFVNKIIASTVVIQLCHMISNSRDAKKLFDVFVQPQSISYTMPKKGNTKAKVVEEDSDLEISLGKK